MTDPPGSSSRSNRGPGVSGSRQPSRVSVIVLGFGSEPYLIDCLTAASGQLGEADELILIDNGIETSWPPSGRDSIPRLIVAGDGQNLGFAGGCLRGAEIASGDVLIFCNSDAIIRAGAVDRLAAAVVDHPERGLVCGCLRLADQPELVNSVGNPLQFLGLTWAGRCGEPAASHLRAGPVPVATGGLFAVRREMWDRLGGFDERYFAYHEDTDLSLRSWLIGASVSVEPSAVADHHYEFARHPGKFYLLERNRWITVLTDYPGAVLRRVVLPLVLVEPVLLLLAVRQGWGGGKLRAWWWLLRHRRQLIQRRREVQATVRVGAGEIAALMTARIEPPMVSPPPGLALLNGALALYWRLVSGRLLRQSFAVRVSAAEPGQADQLQSDTDQWTQA